uniref:tRNA (uracil(54)-C(5))-methyltransferase n=1 Tax=Mesocestoides corti TaxID=53468 RepID=A0A5K3FPH3_MESCO
MDIREANLTEVPAVLISDDDAQMYEVTLHSEDNVASSAENMEVDCTCWQTKSSSTENMFQSPCSSKNCVYAYINSGQKSFEQFKIQLGNVNKFVTVKVMKKFLLSQGLETSKIKPVGRGLFFITFRSAKDRDKAVKLLDGYVFKGRRLEARVTKPAADPFLLRRAQGNPKASVEDVDGAPTDLEIRRFEEEETDDLSEAVDPILSVAPLYQMTYDPDQLNTKQSSALECLKQIRTAVGKINKIRYCASCLNYGFMSHDSRKLNRECCPITPSPILNGYRNKARFTIGKDANGKCPVIGVRLGKYTQGSTIVADASSAPLFSETTLSVIRSFQDCFDAIYHRDSGRMASGDIDHVVLNRLSERFRVYDMVTKSGNWCAVTVRESRLNDRLLDIEIRRGNLTEEDLVDLESVLKQWFQSGGPGESVGVTSVHLTVLTAVSRLPGTFTERCVFGKGSITELCCGLQFTISKDAFFQVNTLATEKLYEEVKQRCKSILAEGNSSRETLLIDICCGTGTIGLCLADCFDQVIGIELLPSAVESAKINAEKNGITNAQFYAGKAEVVLKDLMQQLPMDKEIVAVLDPPRAGVHLGVIESIRRCEQIKHLIFIACDLARVVSNFEARKEV